MKNIIPIILLSTLLCTPHYGFAMQGKLEKHIEQKANAQECNFGFAGTSARDLVKEFNKLRISKIGIDPKLAKTRFDNIDFSGRSLPQALDYLADKVKGKSYALRDFYYIGTELPRGVKIGTGNGKDASAPNTLSTLNIEFSGIHPGQYRTIPFINQTPKECQEEMEPVLLYVVDSMKKTVKEKEVRAHNSKAIWFETFVFADPKIIAVLKNFNCVMIESGNKDWPAALFRSAKGGFSIYLMTCDLATKQLYTHNFHKVPIQHFVGMAKKTIAANKKVAVKMANKLGKDKPEVAAINPDDNDNKDKEGKAKKGGLSILNKNPKKKTESNPKDAVVEEEEEE